MVSDAQLNIGMLLDPNSATYEEMRVLDGGRGHMAVCGYVTSKNRTGDIGRTPLAYDADLKIGCILANYVAVYLCVANAVKACYPSLRIPSNASEATKWDRYGPS